MPPALTPASLSLTAAGQAYAPAFDDVYHTPDGARGQAQHVENLAKFHATWPELARQADELQRSWPILTPGIHRIHLDDGRVTLTLIFGDALDSLPQLHTRVNAFYLDGFSPDRNPELWSPTLFAQLARLVAPGASVATWSANGDVRRGLQAAGFVAERGPGFGGKREMLAGRFRATLTSSPATPSPTALVIGAGVAGTSVAERLAARGWQITVIDEAPGPGHGASGNKAGVFRPLPSLDDNRLARITRAGFLYGLRHFEALAAAGHPVRWSQCGVLHLPPSLCAANLAAGGAAITTRFDTKLDRLERIGAEWVAFAPDGTEIARAAVAILANGVGIRALPLAAALPVRPARGQVSHLPATPGSAPKVVVCRLGYVSPEVDGMRCAGATFIADDAGTELREEEHRENLTKLDFMLPGYAAAYDPAHLEGRVGFSPASPDRLPMIGAVPAVTQIEKTTPLAEIPRQPGLYAASGFGARGLVWASLAGELLASQINGDPLPLERDLVDAMDPARYLLKPPRPSAGSEE